MNKAFEFISGLIILGFMVWVFYQMAYMWPTSGVHELDQIIKSESPPPTENTNPTQPVACTMEAKQCPDGSFVGRVGPNCEFAVCPSKVDKIFTCSDEAKKATACTREFAPVCGQVQVQCVTTPCPPIPETFSNGCSACAQGNVDSYTVGACDGDLQAS